MPGNETWARIVVPLDTSATAETVLPWASLLARDRGMSVHLVTVWDDDAPIPGVDTSRAPAAQLRRYLDGVATSPALSGVPVTVEVRTGCVVEEICEVAVKPGNLVILATHGEGGYVESRLGSVADRLVRRLRVPLFVIPAEDTGARASRAAAAASGV